MKKFGVVVCMIVLCGLIGAGLTGGKNLPAANPHVKVTWKGPATCLQCHTEEANDNFYSVHYQWKGEAKYLNNGAPFQGKNAGSINAYCINITGNWNDCSTCHIGLGKKPSTVPSRLQLANIDCLVCHQKEYRRVRTPTGPAVMVPDKETMTITMNQAVQTVHQPVRQNCLQCHSRAGGGDSYKRGDLTMAHAATTDRTFDVHMATTGANLQCQGCHTFQKHRVSGRGSDLRPTDLDIPMSCSTVTCHPNQSTGEGHKGNEEITKHVARVACQTCHIPLYGKNAADTLATEATEYHRTWAESQQAGTKYHPLLFLANDVKPVYRFWNRYSWVYNLFDKAVIDQETGHYAISRPVGTITDRDSKLYPFKYKTAEQPFATNKGTLVALDTSVYFRTGDPVAATKSGLKNMGYSPAEPFIWVKTDEYQMLNHEVMPRERALKCADCHGTTKQINLKTLGYGLKAEEASLCIECHKRKSGDFAEIHEKHVKDKKYDCSRCHLFSRPERNLGG